MVENENSRLDALFAALSDRTRRAILVTLLRGDATVTELANPFGMSLAAVSKHVQILMRAGLVSQIKQGREKWCKLEIEALAPAALWIESYGQFIEDDFATLEKALVMQAENGFLDLAMFNDDPDRS